MKSVGLELGSLIYHLLNFGSEETLIVELGIVLSADRDTDAEEDKDCVYKGHLLPESGL